MGFYASPLYNLQNYQKIESDAALQQALSTDVSTVVKDDLYFRIEHGLNFIISIIGATGSGKSTVGQDLYCTACDALGTEPTTNDIIFEQTELLDRLKDTYKGHTYIIDEFFAIRTGIGAIRESETLAWIQQVVRAFQVNFIFCAPLEVNRLSHYLIKTLDIDYENKQNRSIVHSIDIEPNGMISIVPLGYLLTDYCVIDGYQDKKMNFIQTRLQQKGTMLHEKHKKIARDIANNYDIASNASSKVIRTVAEEIEPGMAQTEYEQISDYVKAYQIMNHEKEPKKKSKRKSDDD